eukprot:1154220-Pelagomonas_calceolata.AAC.2
MGVQAALASSPLRDAYNVEVPAMSRIRRMSRPSRQPVADAVDKQGGSFETHKTPKQPKQAAHRGTHKTYKEANRAIWLAPTIRSMFMPGRCGLYALQALTPRSSC